jgi:hypothetical protein
MALVQPSKIIEERADDAVLASPDGTHGRSPRGTVGDVFDDSGNLPNGEACAPLAYVPEGYTPYTDGIAYRTLKDGTTAWYIAPDYVGDDEDSEDSFATVEAVLSSFTAPHILSPSKRDDILNWLKNVNKHQSGLV